MVANIFIFSFVPGCRTAPSTPGLFNTKIFVIESFSQSVTNGKSVTGALATTCIPVFVRVLAFSDEANCPLDRFPALARVF